MCSVIITTERNLLRIDLESPSWTMTFEVLILKTAPNRNLCMRRSNWVKGQIRTQLESNHLMPSLHPWSWSWQNLETRAPGPRWFNAETFQIRRLAPQQGINEIKSQLSPACKNITSRSSIDCFYFWNHASSDINPSPKSRCDQALQQKLFHSSQQSLFSLRSPRTSQTLF